MINGLRVLAFIGARSGSKGLINKNIKLLKGKPLMAWTIDAAKECQYVDDIIVSSDSNEYLEIAHQYEAKGVLRPQHLSGDNASLIEALQHSVEYLGQQDSEYDIVLNLQPTSPLRTALHIEKALELFVTRKLEENIRVFSCTEIDNKYAWIMNEGNNGYANFVLNSEQNKTNHARQQTPKVLLPNGAIFILPAHDLTQFYNGKTLPFIMSEQASIDIDSEKDFLLVEEFILNDKAV